MGKFKKGRDIPEKKRQTDRQTDRQTETEAQRETDT